MSDFFYKTKATLKRSLTIFYPTMAAPPDLLLRCGVNVPNNANGRFALKVHLQIMFLSDSLISY